jgi:CubicO group peptidase (beta-lactamase class C family)
MSGQQESARREINVKHLLRLAALSVFFVSAHALCATADPLPRGDPARHGFSAAGLQRIDRFFADEIARDRIPGAVVAIARQGRLVYYKAMGLHDKQTGTPMRLDSVFQLASMTKPMVVVGALTLYEEGKLPLFSPLASYFPQFASSRVGVIEAANVRTEPVKHPITIQDLMRHTSGITYGGRGSTAIHKMWPAGSGVAAFQMNGPEFMDHIAKLPLLHQPGTTWDYSFSIDALGMVIEKVTGKTLGEALQERVWSKVGMSDTTFAGVTEKKGRIAQPLANDPISGKPQSIRLLREAPKFECGGGCAFGTAADYVRFGQMLLNGGVIDGQRVLSPRTVELMTADHLGTQIRNNVAGTEPHREGYSFGLGVMVRTQRGIAAANGSVGDYSWNGANGTSWWNDPKEQLVVVTMTVGPGEIRKYYREQMAALVYGAMER